jgi:DNA repair exonuclease SbcCD ATPase subunit
MNHKSGDLDLSTIQSALIVGKTRNNDRISNGVGKSTVFSAIEWVLYNKVYKSKLESVVRDGSKKCLVEFDFELENRTYRIHRSRSDKGSTSLYLYEKVGEIFESITQQTPTQTEAKIAEIIKLSHKAFQYSVLFRQADLTGLSEDGGSENKGTDRKNLLKEPMNLMRYSKMEKAAQDNLKLEKNELAKIDAIISVLGSPEDEKTNAESLLNNCNIELSNLINSLQLQKTNLSSKKSELDELSAAIAASDSNTQIILDNEKKSLQKLERDLAATIAEHSSLNKSFAQKQLKIKEYSEQLSDTELKLSNLSEIDVVILLDDEKRINAKLDEGTEKLAEIKAKINSLKFNIPNTDKCNLCLQDISHSHRESIKEDIESKLKELHEDLKHVQGVLEKIKTKRETNRNQLSEAQKNNNQIKLLKQQKVSIKNLLDNSSLDSDLVKIKELEERVIRLGEEKSDYQDKIKLLEEKVKTSDTKELSAKLEKLKSEVLLLERAINSSTLEISKLENNKSMLQERILQKAKDIEKLLEQKALRNGVVRKVGIAQIVYNAFSHKGIPTFIINNVLDELQLETNKALRELRPDLSIKFDSELNFTYYRNNQERTYHQLSCGQHVYIALSLKRGLSRVIQKKLGVDIRMLSFDEVDASLDEEGLEAFTQAIKRWQNEFTILVITHRKELKDKFSHAIIVEEGDDGAELTLATSW